MAIILPSATPVTLVLQADSTHPMTGGTFAWSMTHSGGAGVGTVTPSNDGMSALFTPGSDTSDTAVLTVTSKLNTPWLRKRLYRLNDQIIDANLHKQKVTASTRNLEIPASFQSNTAPSEPNTSGFVGSWNSTTGTFRNINISTEYTGDLNGQPDVAINTAPPATSFVVAGYSGLGLTDLAQGELFATWRPSTVFVLGQKIVDTNGYVQKVTTASGAGQSGTGTLPTPSVTEEPTIILTLSQTANQENPYLANKQVTGPTWNTTVGGTTSDNNLTWTNVGVDNQPNFSTSGGTTTDGDLTWTDQGAASTLHTWSLSITVASTASIPLGYYAIVPFSS